MINYKIIINSFIIILNPGSFLKEPNTNSKVIKIDKVIFLYFVVSAIALLCCMILSY